MRLKTYLSFLFLFSLASNSSAQSPFEKLIETKKQAVRDVSIALARQFSPKAWCNIASECDDGQCFPSACSGDSFGPDFKCTSRVTIESQPETCEGMARPNDALLNLEQPFLWIAADATSNSGDGSNITITDIAVRRDVCASKKFGSNLKEAYFEHNLTDWIYSGTTFGVMTIFPGVPRLRSEGYSSCNFNPVVRPWYIPAASGPKDIVFLVDGTSLLQTKNKLFEAFKESLETIDRFDHIAVVIFGASTARPLGTDGRKVLQSATTTTVEKLLDELDSLQLDGLPNVTLAFDTAFDIHQNSPDSSQCSNSKIIVLLTGQQDNCLAQCNGQESCNCIESLRSHIQSRQESLGQSPVTIVAFTEGDNTDAFSANNAERMARTIVCDKNNRGIWRRVTKEDTADTAMSTYSQITAASIFEENPEIVFSEVYTDAGGLGEIFTLARPVYSVSEKRLLAVVGADITVREVISVVGDESAAKNLIRDEALKARRCSRVTTRTSCELQTIRSQPSSAICADVLPVSRCYQRGTKVYMPFREPQTWAQAQKTCAGLENVTATMIRIDNERDNRFVAGFMNADGSWIGLRANISSELMWEEGSKPEYEEFAYKAFGKDANTISEEVQQKSAESSCATADRRGVTENWNIEPCSTKRAFACEMTSSASVTDLCDGEIFSYDSSDEAPVNDVNCVTLASSVRNCTEEEDARMEEVNPICKESNGDFSTQDRLCCGGRSDRSGTIPRSGSSGSFQWWILLLALFAAAVGIIILWCLIVPCCIRVVRTKKNKREEEEKVQREHKRRDAELRRREENIAKTVQEIRSITENLREGSGTLRQGSGGVGSGQSSPPLRAVGRDRPTAPPLSRGEESDDEIWNDLPPMPYDDHYRHSPTQREG